MTAPMDAKLCREAYDRYCAEHGEKDDPFDWHVWQYAWDARATATPAPEVDDQEIVLEIMRGMVGHGLNLAFAHEAAARDIFERLKRSGYLAQGAVRVSMSELDVAAVVERLGHDYTPESVVKAVILSLKQQNPGVQFDES